MDSNSEHIEKILAFLNGQMDPETEELFLKEIDEHPEMKREVEAYQILIKGFQQEQFEAFSEKVNAFEKQLPALTEKREVVQLRQRPRRAVLQIAASIAILIFVSFFGLTWYASYIYSDAALSIRHSDLPIDPRQAGGALSKIMLTGYAAFYDQKDYELALSYFSSIPEGDPAYLTATLFRAHCHFQLGHFEQAAAIYDRMIRENRFPGITDLDQLKWNRNLARFALEGPVPFVLDSLAQTGSSSEREAFNSDLASFWRKTAFWK